MIFTGQKAIWYCRCKAVFDEGQSFYAVKIWNI